MIYVYTRLRYQVSVYRTIGSLVYLFVSCSGSITSLGEERANFSAILYL